MIKTLRLMDKNSLFFKLLVSFLIIIVVLLSFNILSFLFFKTSINEELIQSNRFILNKTVDSYEKQIELINKNMTNIILDSRINLLKNMTNDTLNYEIILQMNKEMASLASNEMLNLDNVLLAFKSSDYLLDKDGLVDFDKMFSTFLVSAQYPANFWKNQFNLPYHLSVFPAAEFKKYNQGKIPSPDVEAIPLLVQNLLDKQVYMIAFLNADQMFTNYNYVNTVKFQIVGRDGNIVYNSDKSLATVSMDSETNKQEGFFKQDNVYYFYKKSNATGLTYINAIPYKTVASKIVQLNYVLIAVLIVSIVASLAISIFLSARFNNPFQKIIETIKNPDKPIPVTTKILEFKLINEQIHNLNKMNRDFNSDIAAKNKLLKQYGYLRKIKNIETYLDDIRNVIDPAEPFFICLFQFNFSEKFINGFDSAEQNEAFKYLQAMTLSYAADHFPGSISMNIEKELQCTIIFESSFQNVMDRLSHLKQWFHQDMDYGFLTIAVKPEKSKFANLPIDYAETLRMIQSRKLNEETQIVTGEIKEFDISVQPVIQEKEFWENLQHGNEANLIGLVRRSLHLMHKKSASAFQFQQFANQVIERVIKGLIAGQQDISIILNENSPYEQIKYCHTLEQYERFFARFLAESTRLIRNKRESNDSIVNYVTSYINQHYSKDISLDLLADQLKLSGGYLSTYFKENFGCTFSEYLNEVRIHKAKELLSGDETSINLISSKVGYQNVSSFIRMFKRMTGMPPGQYRRLHLNSEETVPLPGS
ncbi:hypothetical protein PAT3040_05816 [Paenibacillus agaridevorans]|uniref:HTH araC/xylS-type domain-containing protein n=1 Tax=Paenibacillus agaridevorans TaxID=171404 RepID=A0A2R5EWW7_9BACL|nr:helix-turn-helix domain-containing protein [Paenibacillus agaridevorans]GBG11037.1 hypothetical protein PAT3040_05816 [Paenibacillus agaridevorans]